MKKTLLIALAIIHVFLSITIFIIGSKYAYTVKYTNTWLPNLLVSLILVVVFSKEKVYDKISNLILIIYPIGLILISFIIFFNIPNFTYKEAKTLVIKETSEKFDIYKENEIKGQNGMYYIYTEENVYVFNSKDGSYSKRKNID